MHKSEFATCKTQLRLGLHPSMSHAVRKATQVTRNGAERLLARPFSVKLPTFLFDANARPASFLVILGFPLALLV